MKTVWLLYDFVEAGPYRVPDYKGIFATRAAAEAWRERVAAAEQAQARADGWINNDPVALGWFIEEHEVNE